MNNNTLARAFARVSQELRTPLNTISAMLGLLGETTLMPEQQDYLIAAQQGHHLLRRFMYNLSELSQFELNQSPATPQIIHLSEWLEEVIESVAQAIQPELISLVYDLNPDVPHHVAGDMAKLRYVLDNLLYDAVKSQEVWLHVAHEVTASGQERLHFSFNTTAITLPNSSDAWNTPQISVNLIMAQRVIDLLQGELWWQAGQLHLTLPIASPPPEFPPSEVDLSLLQDKTILLVSSHQTLCQVLTRVLQHWGLTVHSFATGQEVLAWLDQAPLVQVVLFDPDLTDMEGLVCGQHLRQRFPDSPLIVLAPKPLTPSYTHLTSLFLTKPIKYTQLQTTLLTLLQNQTTLTTDSPKLDASFAAKHPLQILLAEHNHVNQKVVKRLLEKMGYSCHITTQGLETLEAFQHQKYNVVLLSTTLADTDSLTVVADIRQNLPATQQPYIIIMVTESPCQRAHYLAQKIDDCLSKPIRLNDLAAALSHCAPSIPMPNTKPNTPLVHLPIIDLSQLKMLIGDYEREMIAEFTDMFMVETPKQLAKMHQSFATNDLTTLQRTVHTLKSSSATFGAMRLAYLCKQLELQLIKGTVIEVEAQITEIETAYHEAEEMLKQIVNT